MKKLFVAAIVALCLLVPSFADTYDWKHGDNESDMDYTSVTVYKVLDSLNAYVILYEKAGSVETGQVVVPKQWLKDNPQRLKIRNLTGTLSPYMSVIEKNGEFYKVVLNLPVSRNNTVWGMVPGNRKISTDGIDKIQL